LLNRRAIYPLCGLIIPLAAGSHFLSTDIRPENQFSLGFLCGKAPSGARHSSESWYQVL